MANDSRDWATVGVLLAVFFLILEPAKPFFRQFRLDDSSLQHPFAHKERVTDNELYLVSAIVPTIIFIAAAAIQKSRRVAFSSRALLGLWVSLTFSAVITDVLKLWIGNPRPDFLERCGAKVGTPASSFVDVSVCTFPLGESKILDGMKSTPLGHSSIAFAGLLYLALWGDSKLRLVRCMRAIPVLAATYIAFSRTQDYRHHFSDVLAGSLLGIFTAYLLYLKYRN